MTDRDGDCLFVNECWSAMAGLSPEEARGAGWIRALHPDDRERISRAWYAAAEARRPFAEEYRFRTPRGEVTWIHGRAVELLDEAGRVSGYLGTLTDVTQRREAVEALEEADRRKDEFLALLAHELRNPLAPLRNGLEVMRLASGDAKVVAAAQDMMDRQLSHMVRLVDDLLDVSRISRNKMELRRARVLLADVVRGAVETARPALEAVGHELTVALPPEPVALDADLTRLAQVFGNLLDNSAKYTEPGGRIRLTARRDGEQVLVAVRGHRDRHPCLGPAEHLRHVQPGGPIHRAEHGRPGNRARARQGPGRDARRDGRGGEPRSGPGQHVHGQAAGPAGPGRSRRPARRPGKARAPPPRGGGASWWWTTTGTRRSPWR